MGEVQARAWDAFTGVLGRHTSGSVAMVGHNMTNLALLCRFLGMELSRFRRLTQSSTGLTILERGAQGLHPAPERSPPPARDPGSEVLPRLTG
jgi:broad specificity phosphatase PhoE